MLVTASTRYCTVSVQGLVQPILEMLDPGLNLPVIPGLHNIAIPPSKIGLISAEATSLAAIFLF